MRLTARLEAPGLRPAIAGMKLALAEQATTVAHAVGERAKEGARAIAPVYQGVARDSLRPDGKPYVIRDLLWKQIHYAAGATPYGACASVGLLPATGEGKQMVPYWAVQNYGQLSSRTIQGVFKGHRKLMFPTEAWPGGAAKGAGDHGGPRKGGYTFDWVNWGHFTGRHFMEFGFDQGMAASAAIMNRATAQVMRLWGSRS